MTSVTVKTGKPYEVRIGAGLLQEAPTVLRALLPAKRLMVVSDDNVFPLYGEALVKALTEAGFQTFSYVMESGEQSKNLTVYGDLLGRLCEAGLTRDDSVIALGGGVVGDLAGFAAATYQRGISYVQMPTSLLAAVDSSVGGKTAVDLPGGKNQVGAFCQPALVLCDIDTLKTLPDSEYRNGCAEIIKYGMLLGEPLFTRLSEKPVKEMYEEIIGSCVAVKRDYVEADEFDRGLRMLLNLGHTAGHGVELLSGFTVPHGQGVAIGMAIIARAAHAMGYCDETVPKRLIKLLNMYGLPTETEFTADELTAAVANDKKNTATSMRIVYPEAVGSCKVLSVSKATFHEWLKAGGLL